VNNSSTRAAQAASRGARKKNRNGQLCPRCRRFGTFAPNAIVCDRCTGALPLVFVTVTITVLGGEA
jgi:hypothetical protein